VLFRRDRGRRERLADLRGLGFDRRPTMELLDGGLLGILGRSRVTVLRRDGSLFASARLRARGERSVAENSGLVANRAGTAVGFTVTEGHRSLGRESLYVLRSGDRRPSLVYSRRLRFALCERWSGLSWRRDWLLYAATEGMTIALDTARPTRRIELTAVTRSVGGPRGGDGKTDVRVSWAG